MERSGGRDGGLAPPVRAEQSIAGQRDRSLYLQRKVQGPTATGPSNNQLEDEADRIAQQATSADRLSSGRPTAHPRVTPATAGQMRPPSPSVEHALANTGTSLDPSLRQDMEQHFHYDFSRVRVHRGAAAEQSARDLNARAFTAGPHIVFAADSFAPHTRDGRRLLAHELTHVVQQGTARAPVGVQAKSADPPAASSVPQNKTPAAPAAGAGGRLRILDKFALDKDTLTPEHRAAIDELATSIAAGTGTVRVEIVGHADSSGEKPHNLKVAQDRADRVKEALEKALARRGGAAPTVDWLLRSAGESEPLIPTGDNKQEPRNRRVEVRVFITPAPAPQPPSPFDASKQEAPPPARKDVSGGKDDAERTSDKVTTKPSPTKLTPAEVEQSTKEGDKDDDATELSLAAGGEIETSKEGTEAAANLSFGVAIPIHWLKPRRFLRGDLKFFNEFSLEPSVGLKRGDRAHRLLTPLAVGGSFKMISLEWENLRTRIGVFNIGIGAGASASGEVTPQGGEAKYDFGPEAGAEIEYRLRAHGHFFLKVEGKGALKWGGKTGGAAFEWQGASFIFSPGLGVHF